MLQLEILQSEVPVVIAGRHSQAFALSQSVLHTMLSHKELVLPSTLASVPHFVHSGSVTGSCLACPINIP